MYGSLNRQVMSIMVVKVTQQYLLLTFYYLSDRISLTGHEVSTSPLLLTYTKTYIG